ADELEQIKDTEIDADEAQTSSSDEMTETDAEETAKTLDDSQEDDDFYELSDHEPDLLNDVDEVGTKLDLARAYIDMGDPDGARSILEEVVQEGNEQQVADASNLLNQIK
ncbi:MAG: pilus assembly protein FimV, partial [Gammaproteobacteria bacterium]|nr:pilus assembly protein FimV [Gammaproteobacteria bacterium]